jgi:uncharacterized membrane protein
MWFLGLVIGAIIGAVGGAQGAILGALFGAGVSWAISQKPNAPSDRLRILESSIRLLQQRVADLEKTLQARGSMAVLPDRVSGAAEFTEPSASERRDAALAEPFVPPRSPELEAEDSSQPHEISPPDNIQPAPVTPPEAPPPLRAAQPSPLWNFFFGGNALVRFGVIVLFFGVGFLLKYASEHIVIPIEARFIAVALGAIVMLAIGWRLRGSRPGYGLIMQGGGIGLLYLTVFAAFRLYQLLPAGLVFVLLVATAFFSAMLAVLQDSRSLAAMGVSGGFLAPILASTGAGSHVMLFSFYAVLNLGILIIAWFKPWRSLNLLGFAFTFIIGLLWGGHYYRADLFDSTEPFLILFFLFYVAIAVLFALRQEASIKKPVDGTLVFGTPLIAFGLQTAMVRRIEYGAAYSALVLSGFYLLLARLLFSRALAHARLLVEAFLALGVVFGTLAVPLAFEGRWTAAVWALEGAAIVWVGVRQKKLAARAFGIFLQFSAGVAFALDVGRSGALTPILNSVYLGCVLISVAGLFCAWYLQRHRLQLTEIESQAGILLFCWGILWWFGGGFKEIGEHVAGLYRLHASLSFAVASCAAFSLLHFRVAWREAKYVALALLPLMIVFALWEVNQVAHPFMHFGFIVWPAVFAVHLWLLRRHEETRDIAWGHSAGLWLFTAVAAWEVAWWTGELIKGGEVWRLIGWPLVPLVLLAWLTDGGDRIAWPVSRFLRAYLVEGSIPLAGFLWLWMLHANFTSRGDATPLPYLPLVNPLDLVQFAALMALFAWCRRVRSEPLVLQEFQSGEIVYIGLGCAGFLWLNGVLLRTLHQWYGVPFGLEPMLRSMLVQASLSIFWSVLALCAMLSATRLRLRPLWLTGAGLMGVVVVKLFFVDLSNVGGIERIVSFIGVGLLMLVIGYVSPVPPSTAAETR